MTEGQRFQDIYSEEQREAFKEKILEQYAARTSLRNIATNLGLHYDTVKSWLSEAIEEVKTPDPAKERQKDLLLVDQAIRALIPEVLNGKASAHMALNRWLERRARYLGLDEPEKLDLNTSFNGSIEDEVKELLAKLGLSLDNLDLNP